MARTKRRSTRAAVRINMGEYFLYHNVEEGREGKTCLYYRDETYTYGDAARLSNRAGGALRELGVETEDRVLLVLPDCPEFVWTWFAVNRVGGVITMVNPLLPADDYRYYLEYTRARVAVIHESLLENFTQAARGPLKSFAPLERREAGADRTYLYRAALGRDKVYLSFTLNGGKITAVRVEEE